MQNPNTSNYWDEQFKEEWRVINTQKWAGSNEKYQFYRWDSVKFGIVGNSIYFRGELLDIACGMGHFCRYIKARNPFLKVIGIDFSPGGIDYAKRLDKLSGTNNTYVVGDAQNLPFKDNSFDTITAMEVVEHISDPDKFITEIKRVLKPRGHAFITTPWRDFKGMKSIEHIREWTPKEFAVLTGKYFKKGEVIFPPAMTNILTKKTKMTYWFMVVLTK